MESGDLMVQRYVFFSRGTRGRRRKEIAAPRPWEGSGRRYGWESLFLEGCEGEVSEPYPEGTESDEEDHGEGQR